MQNCDISSAAKRDVSEFKGDVASTYEHNASWQGIATFQGLARFIGPTKVQVGERAFDSRYILVATGAKPQKLNIPGKQYLTTSEQFLELGGLY